MSKPIYGGTLTTPMNISREIQTVNRLKYYGDADIVPSDAALFAFTTDDTTMTAQIAAKSTEISGDIVIPYDYAANGKTYKVVAIAYRGFQDCTGITKITIPKGVATGHACFLNTKITSIVIPDGITQLPINTFYQCSELAEITILTVLGIVISASSEH